MTSNKPKHTAGPWLRDLYTIYALNSLNCNRFYCQVQQGFDDLEERTSHEELTANAHLISAAPEMLAGLEEAILMLRGVDLLDVIGNSNCNMLADKLTTITDKAKGES